MPFVEGYSREVVRANIAEMRRAKYPRTVAAAAAYEAARNTFRDQHPGQRLPKHLRPAHGNRNRGDWNVTVSERGDHPGKHDLRDPHGRYDVGLEAVCRCGHRRGVHVAGDGRGAYECIAHELEGGPVCACTKFRKARTKKGSRNMARGKRSTIDKRNETHAQTSEKRRDPLRGTLAKRMCWVQSVGASWEEHVPVTTHGRCRRADEGIVGHDVRVRPVAQGPGGYTMVVAPDDLRHCQAHGTGERNRANGKYQPGTRNPWIWMREKPVVRSRNLRGVINYAGKHLIQQISIAKGPNGTGLIDIFFDNGAEFHDEFADYSVLQTWLRESRNFQGAPLEVEGRDANVVMRDSPALKNY